jgi:membrane fusion protein (multidrug efflux system)
MRSKVKRGKYVPIIAVVAVLILIIVLAGCGRPGGRPEAAGPPEAKPLAVEALTVTRGYLLRNIEAAGIVSGINEAYVVSETQGIIQSVSVELGDRVSARQVLVKGDDTIPRLNMEQTKEQFEIAKLDLEATEKLFNDGSASKAELTRVRSAVNGAQARYHSALKTYQDCTIRAPIGSYIAQKESEITLGNYLGPGMRVARVVDISSLKAEVAVGEGRVGRRIGNIAEILDGLEEGETLIISGLTALRRGDRRQRVLAMNFGKFSVNNSVLINILMIAVLVLGVLSLSRSPRKS